MKEQETPKQEQDTDEYTTIKEELNRVGIIGYDDIIDGVAAEMIEVSKNLHTYGTSWQPVDNLVFIKGAIAGVKYAYEHPKPLPEPTEEEIEAIAFTAMGYSEDRFDSEDWVIYSKIINGVQLYQQWLKEHK